MTRVFRARHRPRLDAPNAVAPASSMGWLASLLVLLSAASASAAGPVVINEILANNSRAVPVDGVFPDYVELINATSARVALGGVTLADDSLTTVPFAFPAGTMLEPGARLVVWCSATLSLPQPQAFFGLGNSGDRLRLTGPDGALWDEVTFGIQARDLAVGRVPDGSGTWQPCPPSPSAANALQPTGVPDTLFINEWLASPTSGDDWLELYNGADLPVALGGLVLTDSTAAAPPNRAIPALSFISARGHVQLFASDLRQPDADHLDFRLSASAETLTLLDADRSRALDRVVYGAQIAGTSQGRTPDGGETILPYPPGQSTPGASNLRELTEVVVSEVLSHTDPPLEDAIEVRNASASPVDISGWWLSDSGSSLRKYPIPAGTVLPAGGYRVFYEYQFNFGGNGFSLNSYEGDEVWLSEADASGALTGRSTSVSFGPLKNGVPVGRVETSAGADFAPLRGRTFGEDSPSTVVQFRRGGGLPNANPSTNAVRISEIRHRVLASLPAARRVRFLELHNASASDAPLFDPAYPTNAWRIRGAVQFDLPLGITLAPNARLLVTGLDPATDASAIADFRQAYSIPDDVRILGPWEGSLSAAAFRIELQEPDAPEGPTKPRPGLVPYVRVERVDLTAVNPWPVPAADSDASLQRLSGPPTHANEPAAWTAGAPSPGRDLSPDRDGDGMPDAWETTHGLNPDSPADAASDADADGASNLDEYLVGTHPRDPADRLTLRAELAGPGLVRFRFTAPAQRGFALQARNSSAGTAAPWQVEAEFDPLPAPGLREITLPASQDSRVFRILLTETP